MSTLQKLASLLSPLLSRRLLMAVIALYMVRNGFWGLVECIPTFINAAQLTTFQTFGIAYMSAVVGIAMWYIGNSTWKGGLSVAANLQSIISSQTSEHTERIIDEGASGAPDRRPWTQTPDDN
jgi:hypothetical protein